MSSDFPFLMINFTQSLEPSCHERFSQTHSCNVGSHYSIYNYHVSLIKTQSQLWANKDIIIITLCILNRYFYGVIGMEAFHDFEITFDTPTADHFFYNCGLGFINFRCSMYIVFQLLTTSNWHDIMNTVSLKYSYILILRLDIKKNKVGTNSSVHDLVATTCRYS